MNRPGTNGSQRMLARSQFPKRGAGSGPGRYCRLAAAGLAVWLAVLAGRAAAQTDGGRAKPPQPVVVLHISSLERLLERLQTNLQDVDRGDVAEALQQFLTDDAGGLKGFDRSQPFGVALFLPETLPPRPVPVVYAPVSNFDELIQTLELGPISIKRQPQQEGIDGERYTLTMQRGGTREIVVRDGYAFLSRDDAFLDGDVATLARLAPRLSAQYDAAVAVHVKAISPLLREVFLSLLRSQAQAELQRRDDEPLSQYLVRRANGQSTLELIERTLRDGESLTLGFRMPDDSPLTIAELQIEATPGSEFAQYLSDLAGHPSTFASLVNEREPLTLCASWKMEAREQRLGHEWIQGLAQALAERLPAADPLVPAGNTPAAPHPALQRVVDSLQATVDAGHLDVCLQFRSLETGRFALVGALHVVGGETLAAGLTELLTALQSEASGFDIALEVARHSEVALHRVRARNQDGQNRRVYGDQAALFVGASARTLWFAAGSSQALRELEAAMDRVAATAAEPPSRQPPIQLLTNVSSWLALSQNSDERSRRQKLADAAFDRDNDGLRVEVRPTESGARVRVELEPGFARMLMLWVAERYDRSRL